MKKLIVAFLLLSSAFSYAAEQKQAAFGIDFSLPLYLMVDGNGASDRGNFAMSVEGRHWFAEQMNYGIQVNFDLEERASAPRQYGITPGFAHHWMLKENWRPWMRIDMPVILHGAANLSGSSGAKDIGLSGGFGFAWKLGDAIGLPNMDFRYDFDLFYTFGAASAVPVLGFTLFRAGFDYRF